MSIMFTILFVIGCIWLIKKWDDVEEVIGDIRALLGYVLVFLIIAPLVVYGVHFVLCEWIGINTTSAWVIAVVGVLTYCICLNKHNG